MKHSNIVIRDYSTIFKEERRQTSGKYEHNLLNYQYNSVCKCDGI